MIWVGRFQSKQTRKISDIFGLLIQNASPEKIIGKTLKCQQIQIRVTKIGTFGFIAALGIGLLIFIWKCVVSTSCNM